MKEKNRKFFDCGFLMKPNVFLNTKNTSRKSEKL